MKTIKRRAPMAAGLDPVKRRHRVVVPMTLDELGHVKRLAARRGMTVTRYFAELVAIDAERQQAGLDISDGF